MIANATTNANATAKGQAGGLVGVGKSTAAATASSTVKARLARGRAALARRLALDPEEALSSE